MFAYILRELQIPLLKGKWYDFCFYDYQTIEVHMSTLIQDQSCCCYGIYVLVEFALVTLKKKVFQNFSSSKCILL